MPTMETNSESDNYHPVSRKYLKYLLQSFNDEDSGGGTFAQLASHLIHRRKCANIVPATEPSAGGDLGQDIRTQQVVLDSDGRFRLYESPPVTKERWIFALSIRADWNIKLKSDAAKIMRNNLQPQRIIFVTNQFINPEHVKIDAERIITQTYGVPCEILDGQWILDQLYEQDYSLAVEFLGCPAESDPKLMDMFRRVYGLQEGGLSEDEAVELEQLKTQVQYRNRYTDTPEHLVQDLHRIGNILAPYEAYVEEALLWYEEALPELDRITQLPDGIELLYSYFKALQKLPQGPSKIFIWLPRFIDMILSTEARSIYHYISVWLHALFPVMRGQEPFEMLYSSTLNRLRAVDRSRLGSLSQAYLDQTVLFLEVPLSFNFENEEQRWIQKIHRFLQDIRKNSAFPCDKIVGILSVLAPHLGYIAEYETCFELALELKSKQEGGLSKANSYKARAIAHAQANQLEEALLMLSRAQKLWLNERSSRGYLLTTSTMAHWYECLGCVQAAEYELLQGIHIATWQPTFMESDIFLAMFVALSNLALKQGRVLRAYRWLFYYQRICHMYRLEPDELILKELLEGNLIVLAAYLYTHNPLMHDRLVELANAIDANLLLAYKEIALLSDEAFEVWLSDLTSDQQAEARDVRLQIHSQETNIPEGLVEYNELALEQYIQWQIPFADEDVHVQLRYSRDPELAQLAFTIATMLQIWSVFLHRDLKKLTLADANVALVVGWQIQNDAPSHSFATSTEKDTFVITLMVTPQYKKQIATLEPDTFINFFFTVAQRIISEISLDDPDDISSLFDPETLKDAMNTMIMVGSPAFLWESSFAKTVLGVDDAFRNV